MRVGLRGRAVYFVKKGVRVGEGGGCACKDKACEDVSEKWLLLKRLILGDSQFCQFTDKCQQELKRTRVKSKCKT